jgi:hypothetical protein
MISAKERHVSGLRVRHACTIAALLATVSCAPLPPDHSPDYHYVPVVSPDAPYRTHYALVPDACLTPDPTDNGLLGPHIPPGCANAHNLLVMAEHQRDVVKGRRLGQAPGVTSARAAQKYLYGDERDEHRPLGAGVGYPSTTRSPAEDPGPSPRPSPAPTPVRGSGN